MQADRPDTVTPAPQARRQDGNAMILMPAGVLVMLILAAIGVDTALLFRSQMELENTAAALANDVAASVATGSLFDDDESIEVDRGLLDDLARTHARAAGLRITPTCDITVEPGNEPTAVATCDGTAHLIFRAAVGLDRTVALDATETSRLDTG